MDPDQDVDEEFRHKHDQTFSWRFIRTLSYVDQTIIQKKNQESHKNELFKGDIEKLAKNLYEYKDGENYPFKVKPYLPAEKEKFYAEVN